MFWPIVCGAVALVGLLIMLGLGAWAFLSELSYYRD